MNRAEGVGHGMTAARQVSAILALAIVITLALAAPVLLAPSERIFGMDIVGRHHDPFTVMEQKARPVWASAYFQRGSGRLTAPAQERSRGVSTFLGPPSRGVRGRVGGARSPGPFTSDAATLRPP